MSHKLPLWYFSPSFEEESRRHSAGVSRSAGHRGNSHGPSAVDTLRPLTQNRTKIGPHSRAVKKNRSPRDRLVLPMMTIVGHPLPARDVSLYPKLQHLHPSFAFAKAVRSPLQR